MNVTYPTYNTVPGTINYGLYDLLSTPYIPNLVENIENTLNTPPQTIRIVGEEQTILYELISTGVEVTKPEEVIDFLKRNSSVLEELTNTVNYLKGTIKKSFSLRLKPERDPENEGFETLFLFVVGEFDPKEAFGLLQKIDKEWLLRNISDVAKFNINIEFK